MTILKHKIGESWWFFAFYWVEMAPVLCSRGLQFRG